MANKDIKEPVKLRQKEVSGGNVSLYLDIYWQGRRKYEFLKLYLVPEKNKADRDRNRETLQLANTIKAQRIVEIQRGEYGFGVKSAAETTWFYEYYRKCMEDHNEATRCGWRSALVHLLTYEPREDILLSEITPEWVEGFRRYLAQDAMCIGPNGHRLINARKLSVNSQCSHFRKLRCCINRAIREGIITDDPLRAIDGIQPEEGTRQYLTVEELQRLADTPCKSDIAKRAFLFACLTGLRWSDVTNITWGEVQRQGDFTRLFFRQQKTGGQEYLDIPEQAAELMGEPRTGADKVFATMFSRVSVNKIIREWIQAAGISKDITFHCSRHTFAVMQLDLGTDIYTVSKLLGHKSLNTTQIYAKVMDKAKQAAMQRIPTIIKPTKQGDN